MKIRFQNKLLLVNILTILLIIIITFFPSNVLRTILGLPFLLFFPGYTLIAATTPKRNALDSIKRVALSFGLSIAVVALVGLILNYTSWGIKLYPILVSLTIFIIVTSLVAWYRQRRLAQVQRLPVSLNLSLPSWRGKSLIEKILVIILIAAILGTIGTLSYTISTPKVGEKFTEFYILGLDGRAVDYPRELKVGEEGRVIVGIINREHEIASYRVEVRIDGMRSSQLGPLELAHDEKWEEVVGFTADRAGDNQEVEFLLYKNGGSEPYRKLHLWVDVNVKEE